MWLAIEGYSDKVQAVHILNFNKPEVKARQQKRIR